MKLFGFEIKKATAETPKQASISPSQIPNSKASKSYAEMLGNYAGLRAIAPPNPAVYQALDSATRHDPGVANSLLVILMLASQPFEIIGEEGKPLSDRAKQIIDNFTNRCFSGGLDSLLLVLMEEQLRFGAISAEAEILKRARQIKKIWPVPVPQIRFQWVNSDWQPVQSVNGKEIVLPDLTYRYVAGRLWDASRPYGLPPMLAALDMVVRQNESWEHLDHALENIGLLGQRDIAYTPPPREPGETLSEWQARVKRYQNAIVESENDRERDTFRVHSKEIDYSISEVRTDIRGVDQLYKLLAEQKSSGTGVPEAMMGRSRQVTEAFATVMYKQSQNTAETSQRLAVNTANYYINLELRLNGINEVATVMMDPPPPLDDLKVEQAKAAKMQNLAIAEDRGWIDSRTVQEQAISTLMKHGKQHEQFELKTKSEGPKNAVVCKHDHGAIDLGIFGARARQCNEISVTMEKAENNPLVKKLFTTLEAAKLEGLEAVQSTVFDFLNRHNPEDFDGPGDFGQKIMQELGTAWEDTTAPEWTKAFETYNESIYLAYLGDGQFPEFQAEITDGVRQVVDFSQRFEPSLLTSLWSDKKRIEHRRLESWLRQNFIEQPGDIFGRQKAEAFEAFAAEFKDSLFNVTDYEIRRIQDTYVQRQRNSAFLEEFQQAGVKTARIDTVPGSCDICKPFEGKTFSVEQQYNAMLDDYDQDSETYINRLRNRSKIASSGNWSNMVKNGAANPPFHPHCRHSIEYAVYKDGEAPPLDIVNETPELKELASLTSKEDMLNWAKEWVADKVNPKIADYMESEDLRIALANARDIINKYNLEKLNFIDDAARFKQENGVFFVKSKKDNIKGLIFSKNFKTYASKVYDLPSHTHSAQYLPNLMQAIIIHEMGHYITMQDIKYAKRFQANLSELEPLATEYAKEDELEFMAEFFVFCHVFGENEYSPGKKMPSIIQEIFKD